LARARKPGSGLCKEGRPLKGSLGPPVSGGRKPFPGSQARRGQRLGSHATETGLHARVLRGIGNNDGQLGTMWVALYSILVLLAMFLWI